MGDENNPTPIFFCERKNSVAAVGNFGQYTKVWPGNLVEMMKTMAVVKFDLEEFRLKAFAWKPWPIHVPAAAVRHEWQALFVIIGC